MVWVCENGCLTDGQPTRHANRQACPIEKARLKAQKTRVAPEATKPPELRIPTEPPKPKPPPEKGTWDKFVEFVRGDASTVAAPDVPEKQESYLLEGEDVVSFWQIIFSLFEFGMNLLFRFLEVKELPPELCDIKGSKASSLLVSRNMRHTTSQLFISMGVRTKADAQAIIGEGEGILAFGHIFVGIGWHLITEIPKSPKWKAWTATSNAPAPAGAPAASTGNAWWDPLGVFTKKPEAAKVTTTAIALPAA